MGIFSWIIFGLIAGVIAKLIMPGRDPGGMIVTSLLGIAGALIGGYIGALIGWGGVEGFDFRSFITAVVGAMVLLWGYRAYKKRQTPGLHTRRTDDIRRDRPAA